MKEVISTKSGTLKRRVGGMKKVVLFVAVAFLLVPLASWAKGKEDVPNQEAAMAVVATAVDLLPSSFLLDGSSLTILKDEIRVIDPETYSFTQHFLPFLPPGAVMPPEGQIITSQLRKEMGSKGAFVLNIGGKAILPVFVSVRSEGLRLAVEGWKEGLRPEENANLFFLAGLMLHEKAHILLIAGGDYGESRAIGVQIALFEEYLNNGTLNRAVARGARIDRYLSELRTRQRSAQKQEAEQFNQK